MILIYKSWIILYMPNTSVAEKGSGIQYWRIYACTFPVLTCVVLYVVLTHLCMFFPSIAMCCTIELTHLCMFFPSIDMCCTSIDTFTVCTKLYQYCHMYLSTVLLMTLAVHIYCTGIVMCMYCSSIYICIGFVHYIYDTYILYLL